MSDDKVDQSRRRFLTVATSVLGGVGVRRWRKMPAPQKKATFAQAIDVVFAVLFCLQLAVVVLLSFRHTLGWDGLLIWEMKARYAFLNGGVIPVSYFADATRAFSHPDYPLFLPLTEAWFYLWIGDCDQFWIKLIFPIWYAAGLSMFGGVGPEFWKVFEEETA